MALWKFVHWSARYFETYLSWTKYLEKPLSRYHDRLYPRCRWPDYLLIKSCKYLASAYHIVINWTLWVTVLPVQQCQITVEIHQSFERKQNPLPTTTQTIPWWQFWFMTCCDLEMLCISSNIMNSLSFSNAVYVNLVAFHPLVPVIHPYTKQTSHFCSNLAIMFHYDIEN